VTGTRLSTGGTWIDRGRALSWTLDGRAMDALVGDTVASALLASGERAGFVSPIAGRPRSSRSRHRGSRRFVRRQWST
jgi:hypothetical protein